MIRLSRIWKLYIVYTVVLIVAMTLAGFLLNVQIKRKLTDHLHDDAMAAARIAARCLPSEGQPAAMADLCRTYRDAADWRLTLVRPDGTVVADSHETASRMDNHLSRAEIVEALGQGQGQGTVIRMSPTLGEEMLYAAIFDPQRQMVVRVAMPMSRVKSVENEVMKLASVFLYFVPMLCAIISFFTARALTDSGRINTAPKAGPRPKR